MKQTQNKGKMERNEMERIVEDVVDSNVICIDKSCVDSWQQQCKRSELPMVWWRRNAIVKQERAYHPYTCLLSILARLLLSYD